MTESSCEGQPQTRHLSSSPAEAGEGTGIPAALAALPDKPLPPQPQHPPSLGLPALPAPPKAASGEQPPTLAVFVLSGGGWGSQAKLQQWCTEQEKKSFKWHCKDIKVNLQACSDGAKMVFSYASSDPWFITDAKPTAAQREGA